MPEQNRQQQTSSYPVHLGSGHLELVNPPQDEDHCGFPKITQTIHIAIHTHTHTHTHVHTQNHISN